jgi:hypothetical protein
LLGIEHVSPGGFGRGIETRTRREVACGLRASVQRNDEGRRFTAVRTRDVQPMVDDGYFTSGNTSLGAIG